MTILQRPRRLAWLFGGILALLLATAAHATVYKYVDRSGVSHYTDSVSMIPAEYRNQVKDITEDLRNADGFRVIPGPEAGSAGDAGAEEEEFGDSADFDLSAFDLGGEDAAADILETLGFGVILLGLLAIPVLWVISGLILKLSCRLAGEDPPGLGRACGILFAQGLCGSAVGAGVAGVGLVMGIDESASIASSIAVSGASTLLSWMANAGLLASMMSYGFVKSMWIGFLHTLLILVMIGGPIGALVLIGMMLG
jgi:hypothetical protein